MKPWQHGYDLTYLVDLAAKYEYFNRHALSPFAQVKKNDIANGLHKGTLMVLDDGTMIDVVESQRSTSITMHGKTVIARKHKGDIVFTRLTGDLQLLGEFIGNFSKRNCWLYVWAEDQSMNDFAVGCDFDRIGIKISTFGETTNIYYRGEYRQLPEVDPAELLSVVRLGKTTIAGSVASKLGSLPQFVDHYSNYNVGQSWSALSLRGYTADPAFITKPAEMNSSWQKEHSAIDFELQDTPLFDHFPEIRNFSQSLANQIHRVRFMKLKGGGELGRHTDQVDFDSGGAKGKLARIHVPIQTNKNVVFTVWNTDGVCERVTMKAGEYWFLDTRKPHQAINGGDEDRIHLVIDVVSDGRLYDQLISQVM